MAYYPMFTGRNVPLTEISDATGLTLDELNTAIRDGDFGFATFIGDRNKNRIYCSDKKVWEEIGYYKGEITEELYPEKVKERVFATGETRRR